MPKILFFLVLLLRLNISYGQVELKDAGIFYLIVLDETQHPVELVTVELIKSGAVKPVKAVFTDINGIAFFSRIPEGNYFFSISHAGYRTQATRVYNFPLSGNKNKGITVTLKPFSGILKDVSISQLKPLIQHTEGKVILNLDASLTNVGTTVLEVLEKTPGVMIDNNGTISLQGRPRVMVMIDDKQTFLSGTELTTFLSSMNSSQVEQIELITNPSARYDASGSAGIINIKTRKSRLKGVNSTLTLSAGQGHYFKNNNSVVFNYRSGRINTFLNYSLSTNKYYTRIYALRKYYSAGGGSLISILEQPTFFSGRVINNNFKTGIDFYASEKTTIGATFTGLISNRRGTSNGLATWMNPSRLTDSAITTRSNSSSHFNNWAANINLKHTLGEHTISADFDWLKYNIFNKQLFTNHLVLPGGYSDASQGEVPSSLTIFSLKADHTKIFGKKSKLESGFKTSRITTDNLAEYQYFDGLQWSEDYGKSNHFFYDEIIYALYSGFEQKAKRFTAYAGLRYEFTRYNADQLGNVLRKDSSFSRDYQGLFPAGYLKFNADSNNSFTLTAGRRIDRPPFQKLNPFVFIINKYTYNQGNPYIQPQLSWNIELSHQYKQFLTTTLSFSSIKNYFSQLFLTYTDDILIYTEGNVGRMYNLGLSFAAQLAPFKWWSFSGQANLNYKNLKGYLSSDYSSSVTQLNINLNNQFRINSKYSAELSGYYITKARNDLQELLSPTGQLSAGISRPVFKNKGTLKFTARDIFFTQSMEGVTQFQHAEEYFKLNYDTRVLTLAFIYRFGNQLKAIKRNTSGAADEMHRAESDN